MLVGNDLGYCVSFAIVDIYVGTSDGAFVDSTLVGTCDGEYVGTYDGENVSVLDDGEYVAFVVIIVGELVDVPYVGIYVGSNDG